MRSLLSAAAVMCFAVPCDAGLIFFDDFEGESLPPIPPSYIENYDGFQHWDVLGSGVDLAGPGGTFPPRIDSLMVDLDGTSGSTLITKQSFNLSPGIYALRFDLGGPVGGATLDTVRVAFGTIFSEDITIQEHDPFVTFTRVLTITELTTGKLSFTDLGADSNGAYLDDVSLAAVPEPSSLISCLIGMGCLVARRRSLRRT